MAGSTSACIRRRAALAAAALALLAGPAAAQVLPWEIAVAEGEAGRLRSLAERLSKQYVLYQLRLGETRKAELSETASQIDGVIGTLERGVPSQSIPAPWTKALQKQLRKVDGAWGPLRRIAVASPYDQMRVAREFMPTEGRRADPLLVRYFDDLTDDFLEQTEKLLALYHEECLKTGLEICHPARDTGFAAMLIERAAKEAVYVVGDIDRDDSRKQLNETIQAYLKVRRANDESPFMAEALNPERGVSARAAGELLFSLRKDWDSMQAQFVVLNAGDEQNFDVQQMIYTQRRVVDKIERLTAALFRYASLAYGS
jgi:hypothetical protein